MRNTFDRSPEDCVRSALAKGLAYLVLARAVLVILDGSRYVLTVLRVRPSWVSPLALVVISFCLVVSRLVIRLGIWRLSRPGRWSGLLLGSTVFAVLDLALLVLKTFDSARLGGLVLNPAWSWISQAGGLVFALGLLLTGLVPDWVAALGLAAGVVESSRAAMSRAHILTAAVFLVAGQAVYLVLETCFTVGIAVALLGLASDDALSNKRIERAPQALS
jgi:hypothetical protein